MTQTMQRITLRTACILASLMLLTANSDAGEPGDTGLCKFGEKVWFNAEVVDSDRLVSVCGAKRVNDRIGWLQFRMGVPEDFTLAWPKQRKGSTKAFTYRRYTRYRVTLLKLGFQIDGREYAILEDDVSEDKPVYELLFRVRQASDKKVLESYKLISATEPLALMRLENYVPTKDYDE